MTSSMFSSSKQNAKVHSMVLFLTFTIPRRRALSNRAADSLFRFLTFPTMGLKQSQRDPPWIYQMNSLSYIDLPTIVRLAALSTKTQVPLFIRLMTRPKTTWPPMPICEGSTFANISSTHLQPCLVPEQSGSSLFSLSFSAPPLFTNF